MHRGGSSLLPYTPLADNSRDYDHRDRLVTVVTVWWPNLYATVSRQCLR